MTEADQGDHDVPVDLDRARRRRMGQVLLIGVAVAAMLAVAAGLGGAPGETGAAIFLLVTATTSAIAASYGVVTAIADDLRDLPVSRARVGWVVGLFFAAAALMAMTAGAGG